MKNFFYFVSVLFCFLAFCASTFSLSAPTYVLILPGYFYFTINGSLQEGVLLDGLLPADNVTSQVGHWDADKNLDFLYFYDSSNVPGFRIQMYLDGDFKYSGSYSSQPDISLTNFKVFSEWDSVSLEGKAPTVGVDSIFNTVNIDSLQSCKPDELLPYSSYYNLNTDFYLPPFSKNFVPDSFDYLTSTNSCKNEGKLYIGRFQLDLGVVKAGEYKSSLYVIMLDGY
ncbi:MAG: hypothetical protein RBS56_01695 [Candidatus Gracilibacteria bacterium]|jgi:hypothetical protein|nr:hypothetical protein [Candidatus Gracilibacteria bacterium]